MEITGGSIVSYADDTVVIFSGKTWPEVRSHATVGMNKIKDYLDHFKLTLNLSKTQYVAFSPTAVNRPNFNTIMAHKLG